ncbi:MAG: flagellin [Terracidiphilus sp.]
MALGVLNNLSAIYAENNLNNTNASLQTVLQQLSSGSRINSGADDAAGLSLVNGLEANSTALTQSSTNATEGVGLLQVADGALSQVTSLLDRAVTLATEASNGTLNSTQEAAANQEYQSILAEVNNVGSTTTYNQEQVFSGENVAIYTGDSSAAGASLDDLNIRTLSSSSMGDTDGTMAYSSGQNNAFLDLSYNDGTTTTNAAATDSLSGTTTSITVNYLTTGANGAAITNTATISVGNGTTYANTAQGLMDAINNSGLGLSATFGTAAQAGTAASGAATSAGGGQAAGTDTGIIISGMGVSAGTAPGVVDSMTVTNKVGGTEDTLSGTVSIVGADGTTHTFTIGATDDTATSLATYINSQDWGVTVADANSAAKDVLTFTSSDSSVSLTGLPTDATAGADLVNTPTVAGAYYSVGISGAVTDTSTAQAAAAGVTGDTNGSGGIATISYTDAAGQSLSGTSLDTQSDAETALGLLNLAISDVSAQDGYIGAQINTLNSISQVMSTQQENITSAQNAIQATDYASATSNMSKYEILSQTGIAALAQANSVEQEVLKLLQ